MPTALQTRPKLEPPSHGSALTDDALAEMTQRIVGAANPYAIILFGSYAWGKPRADSDLDLLVVTGPLMGKPSHVSEVHAAARDPQIDKDIFVYTPEQVATRVAMGDDFIIRILERGTVLYERDRPWERIEAHPTMTLTKEWILKAESDYQTAVAINRRRSNPLPDIVGYHCEQCAEKYLKAFLVKLGLPTEKTHDLEKLLAECASHEPTLAALAAEATLLKKLAVDPRYPGFYATIEDAADALAAARPVRKAVRKLVV